MGLQRANLIDLHRYAVRLVVGGRKIFGRKRCLSPFSAIVVQGVLHAALTGAYGVPEKRQFQKIDRESGLHYARQ